MENQHRHTPTQSPARTQLIDRSANQRRRSRPARAPHRTERERTLSKMAGRPTPVATVAAATTVDLRSPTGALRSLSRSSAASMRTAASGRRATLQPPVSPRLRGRREAHRESERRNRVPPPASPLPRPELLCVLLCCLRVLFCECTGYSSIRQHTHRQTDSNRQFQTDKKTDSLTKHSQNNRTARLRRIPKRLTGPIATRQDRQQNQRNPPQPHQTHTHTGASSSKD